MTAYNGMYRCPGGQRPPVAVRGWKGQCGECGRWTMRYPNGKVVMHKRYWDREQQRYAQHARAGGCAG